jgi:ankyrin repeat protein
MAVIDADPIQDTISMFNQTSKSSPCGILRPNLFRVEPYPIVPRNRSRSSQSKSTPCISSADLESKSNGIQLCYPIASGNHLMIEQYLRNGANINALFIPFAQGKDVHLNQTQITPLISAVLQTDWVEWFEHPPESRATLTNGFPPQSRKTRAKIVSLLLKLGANPSACDSSEKSAFQYAIIAQDLKVIRALMSALKDDPQKSTDWTFAVAITKGDSEAHALVELCNEPILPTSVRETAFLHLAVLFNNRKAVELLLDQGMYDFTAKTSV